MKYTFFVLYCFADKVAEVSTLFSLCYIFIFSPVYAACRYCFHYCSISVCLYVSYYVWCV